MLKYVKLSQFLPILTRQSNTVSQKESHTTFTKYRVSADTLDLPVTLTSLKKEQRLPNHPTSEHRCA